MKAAESYLKRQNDSLEISVSAKQDTTHRTKNTTYNARKNTIDDFFHYIRKM